MRPAPEPLTGLLLAAAGLLLAVAAGVQAADYWAADLPHDQSGVHSTAAFTNLGREAETVEVFEDGALVATVPVAGGTTATWQLLDQLDESTLTSDGVVRFSTESSDVKVTLFTPHGAGGSNDAARLLRSEELGTDHRVFAHLESGPLAPQRSFVAAVATQDGTQVTFTPSTVTEAGPGVPAMLPGTVNTFTLDAYEVLNVQAAGDASGTRVESDKPVAVFSGADCAAVQSDGCDHQAEQAMPTTSAGSQYVICASTSVRTTPGLFDHVRVQALAPGTTTVTTTGGGPGSFVLAGAGAMQSFDTADDVLVESDQPVAVAQYSAGDDGSTGDPSFLLPLDTTRYTDRHFAYAPAGYQAWATVAARVGTNAWVDGIAFAGPARVVAGTNWMCQDTPLSSGTRTVTTDSPATAQVYGQATDASYWYRTDQACTVYARPPDPPVPVTLTRLSKTGVRLDWDPPDDGGCPVDLYRVRHQPDPAPFSVVGTTANRTFEHQNLARCVTHHHTVSAVTRMGEGPPSPQTSFYEADPPGPPVGLAAHGVPRNHVGTDVTLGWDAPLDDGGCAVTSYRVYVMNGTDATILGAQDDPQNRTMQFFHHDPCQPVTLAVRAVNQIGTGQLSAAHEVRFADEEDCQPPLPMPRPEEQDTDGDGIPDHSDNCPSVRNEEQADFDRDGVGDACDVNQPDETEEADGKKRSRNEEVCAASELRPQDVTAAQAPDGIEVAWDYPPACGVTHFLVWNHTAQAAVGRVEAGQDGAHRFEAPPGGPGEHRFWVQAQRGGDEAAFAPLRAAPSNLLEVACAECGTPEPELEPVEPEVPPDPPEEVPHDAAAGAPEGPSPLWLVLAAVLICGGVGTWVVGWRKRRRGA